MYVAIRIRQAALRIEGDRIRHATIREGSSGATVKSDITRDLGRGIRV
jgi:hypothetical protein